MTVALGFACTNGIVVAADSEMTTDTTRFDDDKIWYFKIRHSDQPNAIFKIGMAGAGNTRFLVDARDAIGRELVAQKATTLDDAEAVIRGVIHDIHINHIYPIGQVLERFEYNIWTIIGIVSEHGRRLLCSDMTAVTAVEKFHPIGAGTELARFFVSQYGSERPTVTDAVFLSSQILMHGSQHLRDVGGQRRIIVLNDYYQNSEFVKPHVLSKHEEFARHLDEALRPVRFGGTDRNVTNTEWLNRIEKLRGALMEVRDIKTNTIFHIGANSITVEPRYSTSPTEEPPQDDDEYAS